MDVDLECLKSVRIGPQVCCSVAPGGTLEPTAVSDLKDDIYATPAISDGRMYVRTRGWLYCFGTAR